MAWIIINEDEPDLTWSNEIGWVDGDNFSQFTDADRTSLSLPLGGVWEWVPLESEAGGIGFH